MLSGCIEINIMLRTLRTSYCLLLTCLWILTQQDGTMMMTTLLEVERTITKLVKLAKLVPVASQKL